MTAGYLLGIDLGTSGLKACLFDLDGNLIAQAYRASEYLPGPEGAREQSPDGWWRNLCSATNEILRDSNVGAHSIGGIGVCGFHHCPVLLHSDGSPVRPVILLHDQRLIESWKAMQRDGTIGRIESRTKSMISTAHFPPIARYLAETEPEEWARVRTLLLPKDYLRYRLTGEIATEICDATGLNLTTPGADTWDPQLCEMAGVSPEVLPPIHDSARLAGEVTAAAADESGLVRGTPVAFGGGDSHCALVGLGCADSGDTGMLLGTNSTLRVLFDRPVSHPEVKVWTQHHVAPDRYTISASSMAGASVLGWAGHQFCNGDNRRAEQLASAALPGCRGVKFVPYIHGERSPFLDPDATGAFVGLRARHDAGDMIRSVFEGVALNVANCYDLAKECAAGAGVSLGPVHLGGGGSESSLWHHIISDCMNMPIHVMKVREAGSLGAALLAGIAIGAYGDFADAIRRTVSEESTIEPDESLVSLYGERREEANELYRRLS